MDILSREPNSLAKKTSGGTERFTISTVHLEYLKTIHNSKCIVFIESRSPDHYKISPLLMPCI